jgi:Uma2 family endonuclease
MATALFEVMNHVTLSLRALGTFSDEEFYQFCLDNPELKFERSADGQIHIMPNTGGTTGDRNSEINFQLRGWNKKHRLGQVFDSSTAFRLPDTSVLSPDAAWITNSRWESLTEKQRKQFPPLCPDFVVELRSESDSHKELKKKMQLWMENGCQLAWLIDPQEQTTLIYRAGQESETVIGFGGHLSGEAVLPGFLLELNQLVG